MDDADRDFDSGGDGTALLPHAQPALSSDSPAIGRTANFLGLTGNCAAARLRQEQIAAARTQSLGPEHPGTPTTRANLAR